MDLRAITVTGAVPGIDLGITLPHEHLLIDFTCRHRPAADESSLGPQPRLEDRWRLLRSPAGYRANLLGTDVESAVQECSHFTRAGGRTIVDLTGLGLGPDVRGLQRIAERTGLNIIAATGYYIDAALPAWTRTATVDELAQRLIDDIQTGGAEGIRRGAIGEIAIEGPTELELRCVRAAARAQARTGAPVFLHVMSGIFPQFRESTDEIIAMYVHEGGDLRRLVLCHQDGSGDDQAYQERILAKDLWLEYDTFGAEGVFALENSYVQLPTDTQRIQELAALVAAGYAGQLLISQDVCYQSGKRSWGGTGLAHIIETLPPRFVAAGIDARTLDSIMRDNPHCLFAFSPI
jgi:phosphotriesterase-related protein